MPYSDNSKRRAHYHKNIEMMRKRVREQSRKDRWKRKAYQAAWLRQWRKDNPLKAKEKDRLLRKRYRRQKLANLAVSHAIESGRLMRPKECQLCHNPGKVEGHHHRGYAKKYWLDVVWLCIPCHHKQHPKPLKS